MHLSLIPSFLYLALYFSFALSFSVSVGSPPTQCGSLTVSWTGGQGPFQITLIPVFDVPRNISVPSTAFNNNQGSYQISSIPFIKGTEFLLTMSDATGFGAGGTSKLLTVGDPVGSTSCNTSSPALSYSFGLPSSLQQCGPYIFNGYDGATLPVTITGFIPGGDVFLLHPPSSGTSFTWLADVAAGTTVVFAMTDALGHSGGSSDVEMVSLSNNAGCLDSNSPSSTVSVDPSSTSTMAGSPTQTSTSTVSSGTIVGAAVAAGLAAMAIISLAVFYLKRRRSSYGRAPTQNSRRPNSVELDTGIDNFQHPPIYPFPYQTDSVNRLAPPVIPETPSSYASEPPHTHQQHSRTNSNTDNYATFGDVASSSMSSGNRRKAAMAGMSSYHPTTRFVVHTDAEDDVPEAGAEIVELPPQYSARRAPTATHTEERPMSSVSTNLAYLSGQHADEPPQSAPHPPPE